MSRVFQKAVTIFFQYSSYTLVHETLGVDPETNETEVFCHHSIETTSPCQAAIIAYAIVDGNINHIECNGLPSAQNELITFLLENQKENKLFILRLPPENQDDLSPPMYLLWDVYPDISIQSENLADLAFQAAQIIAIHSNEKTANELSHLHLLQKSDIHAWNMEPDEKSNFIELFLTFEGQNAESEKSPRSGEHNLPKNNGMHVRKTLQTREQAPVHLSQDEVEEFIGQSNEHLENLQKN